MTFNFNDIIDAFGGDTPLIKIYGSNDYLLWEKNNKPDPPVISCYYNDVTITGLGIIYYKIDDGEWYQYTGSFKITQDCTIYAYVYYNNAYSDTASLYCTYIANIYTTPWFTANYYKYNYEFSQYSDLSNLSQLVNRRESAEGSDVVRFVIKNTEDMYLQFSDYSFARYTKNTNSYRLNPDSYYTTTDINNATKLSPNWVHGSVPSLRDTIQSFTYKYAITYKYATNYKDTMIIGKFNQGTTYTGNDAQGTATVTFGLPKQTNRTNESVRLNSLAKYIQYLLSERNQTDLIRNGRARFATMRKWNTYTDYPFNYFNYVNSTINGVSIWKSGKYEYVYTGYEIELT